MLDVPEGAPVLEVVRLRRADDQPIAVLTNHLPERVVTFGEERAGPSTVSTT